MENTRPWIYRLLICCTTMLVLGTASGRPAPHDAVKVTECVGAGEHRQSIRPTAGRIIYVAVDGDDAATGLDALTPLATVARAISLADDGDVIRIGEGTFSSSEELVVTNAIEIRGAGIDRTILTTPQTNDSKDQYRTIRLGHRNAILGDVTVTGGKPEKDSTYGICLLIDENGGMATRCRFTGNTGKKRDMLGTVSLLSSDAVVSHCIIDHNDLAYSGKGGGVYIQRGTLDNCLILGNRAERGGGLCINDYAIVRNCTIYGNESTREAGGLLVREIKEENSPNCFQNVILYGNRTEIRGKEYKDEWTHENSNWTSTRKNYDRFVASVKNCIFGDGVPVGDGSISCDPAFADVENGDFSLLGISPAIDAGTTYGGTADADLAGSDRISGTTIDIGCYEYDQGGFSCSFAAVPKAIFEGEDVTLTPVVHGVPGGGDIRYSWRLTGPGEEILTSTDATPTFSIPEGGRYDVALTATSMDGETEVTSTHRRDFLVAARTNYLAISGESTPESPWKTKETACNDLFQVLHETIDGSVVIMGEGEFAITNTLVLDKGVTLVGAGIDKTVLTTTQPQKNNEGYRTVEMYHRDAVLSGMTITGGKPPNSYGGGGILIARNGGTVSRCRITGHSFGLRGVNGPVVLVSDDARLLHCMLDDNKLTYGPTRGGGVYLEAGLVENCFIHGNSCDSGGGVAIINGGTVRNCTIIGNTAGSKYSSGGGVYIDLSQVKGEWKDHFQNNIVYGNFTPFDVKPGCPEWSHNNIDKEDQGNFSIFENATDSCLFGETKPFGRNPVIGDPKFVDPGKMDYSLQAVSPAIDAGVIYSPIGTEDFAGNPRVIGTSVDVGCYEYDTQKLSCGFEISPIEIFEGESVTLTPIVHGIADQSAIGYSWTVETPREDSLTSFEESPTITIPKAGRYDVTLTATDRQGLGHTTYTRRKAILVATRTNHLAIAGTSSPVYPWKTPQTAHTNLFEVIAETIDGSVIVIGEGTFKLTDQVSLLKGVSLVGAGIDKTIFTPIDRNLRTRLFMLNHPASLLQGVTVMGSQHSGDYGDLGNGVFIDLEGGTIRGCRVTGSRSHSHHHEGAIGVTSPHGYVLGCIIDHNTNSVGITYGGGLALRSGVADGCLILDNYCNNLGGGVSLGKNSEIRNSLIKGNKADKGGGVFIIPDANATMVNCTVVENESLGSDTLGSGGGIVINHQNTQDSRIINTIFAGNRAENVTEKAIGWPEWHTAADIGTNCFRNCLFLSGQPAGFAPVVGDPLFKDPDNGDYTLRKDSPAHDRGLYMDWMDTATDLAGNVRIDRKKLVDIGCYETPFVPPMTLLLIR